MIHVQYTYTCDCCQQAVRDPQGFSVASGAPPAPDCGNYLGQFLLCDGCYCHCLDMMKAHAVSLRNR